MGVDALSMNPASLVRVNLVILSFTLQRARSLLDEALGMEDGFAVHRLLNGALEEAGVLTSSQTTVSRWYSPKTTAGTMHRDVRVSREGRMPVAAAGGRARLPPPSRPLACIPVGDGGVSHVVAIPDPGHFSAPDVSGACIVCISLV